MFVHQHGAKNSTSRVNSLAKVGLQLDRVRKSLKLSQSSSKLSDVCV